MTGEVDARVAEGVTGDTAGSIVEGDSPALLEGEGWPAHPTNSSTAAHAAAFPTRFPATFPTLFPTLLACRYMTRFPC